MFADDRDNRHIKTQVGPWRGIETALFDKVNSLEGACQDAVDVIFERLKPGAGTPTPARVRPGRRAWNTDTLWPRAYLMEAEPGEAGWTFGLRGALSTAQAKAGFGAFFQNFAGTEVSTDYRVLPTVMDVTQGGRTATLASNKIVFWYRQNGAAGTSLTVRITSDAAPGAYAGWVDYLEFNVPLGAAALGTWHKAEFLLSAATSPPAGAFAGTAAQIATALANISAVGFQGDGLVNCDLFVDEVYIESQANGHVVGLGSFLKATNQNTYVLAKAGESLYIDENETKTFTKVKSGLAVNAPAYFAQVYNQIFMADGSDVLVVDATKNALGNFVWRRAGFPAPDVSAMTPTAIGGGTAMTAGNHFVGLTYIYGAGAEVYGQSSVSIVPTPVAVGAGQQIRVTNIPVPSASEGVVKKRLYVGLFDAQKEATTYFALELDPSDTDTIAAGDIDISDADLTVPLNPTGPIDNGLPPTCRYVLPFEGSMLYLRLSSNPSALGYSRRGLDINSGPEIVPGTNLAANQRGEGWTGGIVRGGAVYLFTRRSVHAGRFNNLGNLVVGQLESTMQGGSVSVGAVDMNAIWIDDDGNILFQSEFGIWAVDPSDKVVPLSKRKMKDEWKDVNDLEAVNSFAYRTFTSQADWQEGSVSPSTAMSNLDMASNPGILTYKYPYSSNVASSTVVPSAGLQFWERCRSGDAVFYNNNGQWPAGVPLVSGGAMTLQPGRSVALLFKAERAITLDQIHIALSPGQLSTPQSVNVAVELCKYKYEMGRPPAPNGNYIGSPVATSAIVTSLNYNTTPGGVSYPSVESVTFSPAPGVNIPGKELFWIKIKNNSAAAVVLGGAQWATAAQNGSDVNLLSSKRTEGDYEPVETGSPTLTPTFTVKSDVAQFGEAPFGNAETATPGTTNTTPRTVWVGLNVSAVQATEYLHVNHTVDQGALLQRWASVSVDDASLLTPITQDHMGACGKLRVQLEVMDPGLGTYTNPRDLDVRTYVGPGIDPPNTAFNFYNIPDYRPLATYPGAILTQFGAIRLRSYLTFDSTWGDDCLTEAQSRISMDETVAWGDPYRLLIKHSWQSSFASEPYAGDTWTSPVIDMVNASSWGKFFLDYKEEQHFVQLQARTDNNVSFTNNPAWVDIAPNSIPTTAQLPINGQFLQVRIIFRDRESRADSAGTPSEVSAFTVSWQLATQGKLRPLMPPAGCHFEDYSLLSYAPAGGVLNQLAWCLSPGVKFSRWTNQPVNVWLVHNKTLLAGMAGTGKITEYWKEDYQDDGVGLIAGDVTTQVLSLGTPNVKSFMGVEVFTGVTEYMGAPVAPGDVSPLVGVSTYGDLFTLTMQTASTDRSADTPPTSPLYAPVNFPILTDPYADFITRRFDAPTHNHRDARIPALAQSYFFDMGQQDSYLVVRWRSYAHRLPRRSAAFTPNYPQVNRFPYLTMVVPEFYVENYGGVHSPRNN